MLNRLRLYSGLVLLVFVTGHLINTALGIISDTALERGHAVLMQPWHSLPGTVLLAGAAVVHMATAFWALYTRRSLKLPGWHLAQTIFGLLIRISTMVDADAIVIPIAASFEPNQLITDAPPRVRLTMTVIEPRSGRVGWFGIEESGDFDRDDPRALASAVERLARTLLGEPGA